MAKPLVVTARRFLTLLACGVLIVAALASPAAAEWRAADDATAQRANGWMSGTATGWMPNRGQVADTDGRVASNVLYSTSLENARVYVTTSGMSHYFTKRRARLKARTAGPERGETEDRLTDWARLDLELEGAVIRPERARAEHGLEGQGGTNFYLPHCPDGVMNVPTYGRITFPDVYPGIDWVIISEPGEGVHHDFVVHPGADASRIRLAYAGATEIELSDDSRSLRVRTSLGEVREGALYCYQGDRSRPVGARFSIDGHTASVIVDEYDRSLPLVIDPPMVWATYYGGSNYDGPRTIYTDNVNGYVYVVGYNASTDLPVQNPGGGAYFQGTLSGLQDGFIWKFDQAGVRIWATYYGGSFGETHSDCSVDGSGNLYVCGVSPSTDLPTQFLGGAYNQPLNAGFQDGYILKFDSNGVRQWATYYGGDGEDLPNAITADSSGRLYVCGTTTSTNLPLADPGGGAYFQNTLGGNSDSFILRFSALGALEWATYYGGNAGTDEAYGVVTAFGRLYVTGASRSIDFPTLDPGAGAYYQPVLAGEEDATILRFNLAGVLSWATYFGGDSIDVGDEPVVDGNGNMFLAGYTVSSNLPTFNPGGSTYFQGSNGGEYDMFLARFSPTNAPFWSTYIGGTSFDYQTLRGKPIALDSQGQVYLTGVTSSTDLPVLNPGGGSFYQGSFTGTEAATIALFQNDGTLVWSTYFSGSNWEFGTSVAVGTGDCMFATGESVGAGALATLDPGGGAWYQSTNAGSDDGYILKFCQADAACCLDFNCVQVVSQAQCTQLGGTAFYPNTLCVNIECTIDCTICGRKFSDLNRNGVQDNGEPGLAGWTIALYYQNGPLFATTTTDSNGDYCFNNIPCNTWVVREVQQPGWVQTWPAGGSHTVSLGTGATQNGVNFGNYACASITPCIGLPPHVAAWWPFGGGPGVTTAVDVTRADPARNQASITGAISGVDALCFTAPADRAVVPAADQIGLDFAAGSFSIAAWIDATSTSASPRMIAEKRALTSAMGYETRGWALYLDGLQSYLEIGTGGAPQVVPGPTIAAGSWSQVLVSIDRAAGEGRWYLDGTPAAAFNFVPIAGDVSNNEDLSIGQVSAAFGASPGFQGCIGDLAIFSTALSESAAKKAWDPGPISWCPEFALMPTVTTFCKDDSTVQVCFNTFNNNATPQTYTWSLAGLPAGAGCTVDGPVQFGPAAGAVTVPAGSASGPICVTIKRPAGLTAHNATACFALTFVNNATGVCRSRTGTLRADNSCWCLTQVPQGVVPVAARIPSGATIGIGVGHPCDPISALAYRLRAVWLDPDHPDPLEVSLNGLTPGTPVLGEVTAGPGAAAIIDVIVSYPSGYDPAARYEIVVEADTDGDGNMEQLGGVIVEAAYDGTENVGVDPIPAVVRSTRLAATPNPFTGGSTIEFTLAQVENVDLGVYDLSGRLVRSLARGRLAPGAHRFAWNGQDDGGRRVPAGVYFVRLAGSGNRLEAKLVKMQ